MDCRKRRTVMLLSAERAQQIDFSDTYYESNLVVIIRK